MRARLQSQRRDAGFTLVELLVASVMGVVVMGAVASLVISAVRDQPKISQQAQTVTTARWVLERMTRELRNGIVINKAKSEEVSFQAYVRHSSCGGTTVLPGGSASIKCQITYACSATSCSRRESAPEAYSGTFRSIFSGIDNSQVFTYAPNLTAPTYVKMTLHMPSPSGTGSFTVSGGTSLRNATLGY